MNRTPHNKSIKVTALDSSKNRPIKAHPSLPQFNNWLWLLFGKPHRGKTTLALHLVKEYQDDFDFFFIVSPTAIHDSKIENFKFRRGNKNIIGEQKTLSILTDIKQLPQLIEKIEEFRETKIKGRYPQIFLFLDDITGEQDHLRERSDFSKFSFRRRHFNTAILLAVHRYKSSIKHLRETADLITLFGQTGEGVIKDIVEENFLENRDDIKELIKETSKIPHAFVTFNDRENKIMRNLDEEIRFD